MRVKLVWIAVIFLLLDVVLAVFFFLSRGQKETKVFQAAPSPSPKVSPQKKRKRPELLFESKVAGVKIKVVDKKAVERVLSEVKFYQAWVATPKVQTTMDSIGKVKVVLTDKRQVDKLQEVQVLQNADGEVYQATGIELENQDTLVFYIFLSPKFFKSESQERLTLRFLSQFLRTAAAFGLEGQEYEEFVRTKRLGKILLERWKERLPVVLVVSSKAKR